MTRFPHAISAARSAAYDSLTLRGPHGRQQFDLFYIMLVIGIIGVLGLLFVALGSANGL